MFGRSLSEYWTRRVTVDKGDSIMLSRIRRYTFAVATLWFLGSVQPLAADPIIPAAATTIEGAGALGASAAVGWSIGSFIRGAEAYALGNADGTQVQDPAGGGTKGGWFRNTIKAVAPAVGGKGSKVTTESEASSALGGDSNVTFPVQELGEKPGAAYYGYGFARGGVSQSVESTPAANRS